ncbi:hypothetical protein C0R09_23205 [Brevibacillus laterosporus]|nr:hypothetical protein C0R09_23205 [Brevibacillus laterosporus]
MTSGWKKFIKLSVASHCEYEKRTFDPKIDQRFFFSLQIIPIIYVAFYFLPVFPIIAVQSLHHRSNYPLMKNIAYPFSLHIFVSTSKELAKGWFFFT